MSRSGVRFRLTVRRLMAIVVLTALILAVFRINPSLGSFVAGVLSLATIRTFRKLDAFQAHGMPLRLRGASLLFRESTIVASVIIGVSSLVLFFVYGLFAATRPRRPPAVAELYPPALFLGVLAALPVACWLRKKLW